MPSHHRNVLHSVGFLFVRLLRPSAVCAQRIIILLSKRSHTHTHIRLFALADVRFSFGRWGRDALCSSAANNPNGKLRYFNYEYRRSSAAIPVTSIRVPDELMRKGRASVLFAVKLLIHATAER